MEHREPAARAVFDTSPIIFLDVLGYVSLLRTLYRVVMPDAVRAELSISPASPGGGVVALSWIAHRTPTAESLRTIGREPSALGRGETAAIALGLDLACAVVLDDRQARRRARQVGLEVTGTVGILLRLHRLEHATRSLEDDLQILQESGMHLSPALRRRVIELGAGGPD